MAAVEGIVLLLIGKERFQPLDLKAHFYALVKRIAKLGGRKGRGVGRRVHSGSDGGEKVRMGRRDNVVRT